MTVIELMDFIEAHVIWTVFGLIGSFFVFPTLWAIYMTLWRRFGDA